LSDRGAQDTRGGSVSTSMSFETRGHCPRCADWFVIPSDTLEALSRATCPDCDCAPDGLENRCGDLRIALSVGTPPVGSPAQPQA
jgi:hypothetical protein